MKRNSFLWVFLCLTWLATTMAEAKLNVVATLPDFAAIAREVGGDLVKVTSLARGTEDPHYVDARPSFIRVLNRADVLIHGGADLEIGWLPPLVANARNRKILSGQPGHVNASRGIALLGVPTGTVDRSQGDVHVKGNPHYWLDPDNGKIIGKHLAEVFGSLDIKNASTYQANLEQFTKRIEQKLAAWKRQMSALEGVKVLTYHKTYEYFAQRFGLVIVDQLEPKPGIEPSPGHIARLIPRAKSEEVKLVLIEPFRARKTPKYVAKAIGAKLILMPDKVESNKAIKDYLGLFDFAVRELEVALK